MFTHPPGENTMVYAEINKWKLPIERVLLMLKQ